jgi:hypothetical protein
MRRCTGDRPAQSRAEAAQRRAYENEYFVPGDNSILSGDARGPAALT